MTGQAAARDEGREQKGGGIIVTGPPEFSIVLRGYDQSEVDDYLDALGASRNPLPVPDFTIVLRGYERTEVDQYLQGQLAARQVAAGGSGTTGHGPQAVPPGTKARRPEFTIVLRGYKIPEVDRTLADLEAGTVRPSTLPQFTITWRGYERTQVDAYVQALLAARPG